MADFTNLRAEVKRTKDGQEAASKLIRGLAAQLVDAKDDPAEILAIAAEMRASADGLAADVVEFTPAEGEPSTPA